MTVADQLASRTRRAVFPGLAVPGLVAVAALLAAGPGTRPAAAQDAAPDCKVSEIASTAAVTDTLERLADSVACLTERVEALREQNAALRNRLDVVEDERGAVAAAYRNVDGTVDRKDRYFGPATFVLTGDRQGRARSLPLDHDLVLAMCADADGCLVTLGLTGAVVDGEPVETMFATGPCTLQIDAAEGTWSLSGLCAEGPLPPVAGVPAEPTGAADAPEQPEPTDPQADPEATETAGTAAAPETAAMPGPAPRWGRDGNARPFGDTAQEARVLLDFAGACFLAEAPPEVSRFGTPQTRFGRDTDADLFLVSGGTGWDPTGAFPVAHLPMRVTDPTFECRLTLRD